MQSRDATSPSSRWLAPYRGPRSHRFMESADINAAFGELFKALRTAVRRGLTNHGQLYAVEMDACIPGEVLGTSWIPLAARGIDGAALAEPASRRALYQRLFAEPRPETLLAYVCERTMGKWRPQLFLEVASADGCWSAAYPVRPGTGWHVRELSHVPHRRADRGPKRLRSAG
jgi:hypothetical protein